MSYFSEVTRTGSPDGLCTWDNSTLYINHGLNDLCPVVIFDNNFLVPIFSVQYIDDNRVSIDFPYFLKKDEKIFVMVGVDTSPFFNGSAVSKIIFDQNSPECVFTNNDLMITHNLGGYISISVFGENNYLVNYPVEYIDGNNVIVSFPELPTEYKIFCSKLIGVDEYDITASSSAIHSWVGNKLYFNHGLCAKVFVSIYLDNFLRARLPVHFESGNSIEIEFSEFDNYNQSCKLIIDTVATSYDRDGNNFISEMIVLADKPSAPTISCFDDQDNHLNSNLWHEIRNPIFKWNKSTTHFSNVKYYYALNRIPNYPVGENDDVIDYVEGQDIYSFTAELKASGLWYFHLRPRSVVGIWTDETFTFLYQFNSIPGVPRVPFYINGQNFSPQTFIYDTNYNISWQPADDYNLDELTYHVQIAADSLFLTILYEQNSLDITELNTNYETVVKRNAALLNNNGFLNTTYFVRIRAYDGYSYSPWTLSQTFRISSATNDLKFSIYKFPRDSYFFNDLESSIDIVPYTDFPIGVRVLQKSYEDFLNSIRVLVKWQKDFNNEIFVNCLEDFSMSVDIPPYQDLKHGMQVIQYSDNPVFMLNPTYNLNLSVMIARPVSFYPEHEFKLSCVVARGISDDRAEYKFTCGINILTNSDFKLSADIWNMNHLPNTDDFAIQLRVLANSIIRNVPSDFTSGINVNANKPGVINVSCNLPQNIWNITPDVRFTWTKPEWNVFDVSGYYIAFDKNKNKILSVDDEFLNKLTASYNFNLYETGGKYYFHIKALNSVGISGPQTDFEIWYNIKPTAPSYPFLINGLDCFNKSPILTRNQTLNFFWGNVIDTDKKDIITYQLQVCNNNNNFIDPVINVENIVSNSYYRGSLSSNIYYWRVRAFDGNEYSDWTPICSFSINTPPAVPTNLRVILDKLQ